ncbi:MAG TPA: hypothetical protein VHB51_01870 [Candidatus Saccharimonadales bacterium]|nr:hypothetical protein [Candidatus Saccharimonadales bacterium]
MTSVTDDSFQQSLRKIIREEVGTIVREEVRPIIREEVRPIIREEVRPIIREETADMRADIAAIKKVQGQHSLQLGEINATLGGIKNTLRGHSREIHRTAVLLEDLDDRFKAAAELN